MTNKPKPASDEWYRVKETEIAHIAGLFDGSGVIRLQPRKRAAYDIGYVLSPIVRIIGLNKNGPMMGKLIEYCDNRDIGYSISEADTQYNLNITGQEGVRKFLEPIEDHLVAKFYPAHVMLTTALPAFRKEKHTKEEGFLQLMEIADMLREQHGTKRDVKYDKEFFEKEFSLTE